MKEETNYLLKALAVFSLYYAFMLFMGGFKGI